MATDQELNEYVSVKKYAPYRQDKGDRFRWNKKDQEKLHELKSKVKDRLGIRSTAGGQALGDGGEKAKKRKGKKERLKARAAIEQPEEILEASANDADTTSMRKRKREGDKGIVQTEPEPQKKKKRGCTSLIND